jgi:hypothetical protein
LWNGYGPTGVRRGLRQPAGLWALSRAPLPVVVNSEALMLEAQVTPDLEFACALTM